MSKLQLATYELNEENISHIDSVMRNILNNSISLLELKTIEEVKKYTTFSNQLNCRLLVIKGDNLKIFKKIELDVNEPLAILQLWDELADLKEMPPNLATNITVASVKSSPKEIETILKRMIDEVAARWERLARHRIQSEYDEAHIAITENSRKTSSFFDTFFIKIKEILQAESITIGCCLEETSNLSIISKQGDSRINHNKYKHNLGKDKPEYKHKQIETRVIKDIKKIVTEDFEAKINNLRQQDNLKYKIIQSSFFSQHYSQVCVLYEFESSLPDKIFRDVCHTATRELRRLQEHCIGQAAHGSLKQILQAQQKLLDEKPFKQVLEYLLSYFNANGASIYIVTRRDDNILDLEKTYMHYGRYEHTEYTSLTHGYIHHCITNEVALIFPETKKIEDHDTPIDIAFEYRVNDLYEGAENKIELKPFVVNGSSEDEKSLMILPLFCAENQSQIIGAIKLGDFTRTKAFTVRDLVELKIFGEALSFLIYTLDITHKLEHERDIVKQQSTMVKNVEQLFFWREIALGVFHQVANYLSEAGNQMILAGFELKLHSQEFDSNILQKSISQSRESISQGKKLIRETYKRGKDLKPILSSCYLIKDILKPAINHVNKPLKLGNRNWNITHSFTDKDYEVLVDAKLTRECIINLLNNAVWAVSDRKITKKKVFVVARPLENENLVKIEVQDSGIGISQKDIHKLFTPFFSRRENGTGLGLFFAKKIIQEHFEGDVKLIRPQNDTIFMITLPMYGIKNKVM